MNCTNLQKRPRAAFHTLGCRLNQSETVILREKFEAAGYEVVPFGEAADVGVVNTCTVTREADAKSRKLIRGFIRQNPDAYVAVIGCYSQMGAEAIAEIPGVDLIVGNQEKLNVLDYVRQGRNAHPIIVRDRIERDDFTIETAGFGAFNRRANLKIQDGCDFMCAFCVIPFARGRARSRQFGNLLDEARQLAERGAKELVLTGVNIGTYDHEGRSILDVVDALNEVEGLERIRISSIEPTTIPVELFTRMNDEGHALTPYLHIPLQSGSNHVLGLMKRRYTREEFADFIAMADESVPDICIGTDVLVGMPGESGGDFEETAALLAEGPIAYAHVFKYSEREGTASVRYAGKVDPETVNARSALIRQISARKLRAFHERHLRRTHRVLFEQCEGGHWTGFTENYIRVAAPSRAILENESRAVRLLKPCGDLMLGEIEEEAVVAREGAVLSG